MQDQVPDLNAVAIFTRVVEQASFRGAAKSLAVPRSTVSMKVAELERALGIRLLDRTTRVVRATEAGRAYLEAVAPALEALQQAGRSLADLEAKPVGQLRLTAPAELGQFLFGHVFATYLDRHPEVSLQAELTARHVDLLEEGFDLALRAGPLPDSSLIAQAIGAPQQLSLCASPSYLRRRGTPCRPADLVEHDCLVMSDRQQPAAWEFRDGRKRLTIDVRPRASINSFQVLRDLAVAGHGVTWLPAFLAAPLLLDGKLEALLVDFAPPARAYHVLYPSSRRMSARVRAFIAVLAESV